MNTDPLTGQPVEEYPDNLYPVVIAQTVERVVWIRACAPDRATELVAPDAAGFFAKGHPYREVAYDVRTAAYHLVPSSLREESTPSDDPRRPNSDDPMAGYRKGLTGL